MNPRFVLLHIVLPLGLAAPLVGCGRGDGLPRQEVTGKVTLDGQPLADGTIQFHPEVTAGRTAVSGGALVSGGEYRIGRDTGLVPGVYKVLILSHGAGKESPDAPPDPGAQSAPLPEQIPARYNTATTLNAEVSEDRPNVFNFDLKK